MTEPLPVAAEFPFDPPGGAEAKARIAAALPPWVAELGAAEGSLLVCDDRAGDLIFAVSVGPSARELVGLRRPIDDGLVGLAASFGQPQISNTAPADPDFDPGVDEQVGSTTRSLLAAPVATPQGVVAVLTAINRQPGFTADDLASAQRLAQQIAHWWDGPPPHSHSPENPDPA
ncbi:MAG: GAF domain-containing protein [Planctomycetota bacterium]